MRGFVVIPVDGDQQPFGGQAQVPGHEIPGMANCLPLEVVAEAEIAQHLEESVMAGGISDVFQIVVFAAGPKAALYGHGPRVGTRLPAQKNVLELDHTGVGEQQGRIVVRHQGRTG